MVLKGLPMALPGVQQEQDRQSERVRSCYVVTKVVVFLSVVIEHLWIQADNSQSSRPAH